MSYTVLARRYRSRTFDEIVGQEPIARTLRNAIERDRTAHAYLFCGTRGVGKTSMARIFARTLNATGTELREGEAIGDAILRGDDLDVIEIDAASNRGVQEARDLIAGAGLSPARCPYRIYIIDEVHMLTREAFNTLLKTMEEPPAHVKFILCTTEPHKVPATIQSRCQRFDFRPIPAARIAEHLREILKQEKIEADDQVITAVARLGRGSMRDALSLLDRLLAVGEDRLTVELLEQMLGVPDQALVSSVIDAIIAGDPAAALRSGAALLDRGTTIEQAFDLLAEHLRSLMVVAACGPDDELLELAGEQRQNAERQAASFDAAGLVHMIALCDSAGRNARFSSAGRALFDAALVRLALSERLADVAGLLSGGEMASVAAPRRSAPATTDDAKKKEGPGLTQPSAEAPAVPRAAPITAGAVTAEPKPAPAVAPVITPDQPAGVPDDADLWPAVLRFAARSVADQVRVEHLDFVGFDGRTVRLRVQDGAPMARTLQAGVADLVQRATGRAVRVELEAPANERPAPQRPAGGDDQALREVQALPAVVQAMQLFDAVVIGVEDDRGDAAPTEPEQGAP